MLVDFLPENVAVPGTAWGRRQLIKKVRAKGAGGGTMYWPVR